MLKVWELSDLDRDGMLDRDEFSVVRMIIKIVEIIIKNTYTGTETLTCKTVFIP